MNTPESGDGTNIKAPDSDYGEPAVNRGAPVEAFARHLPAGIQWRLFPIAILFGGCVTAGVAALWHAPQTYPDVVAGAITLQNGNKNKEFIELFTFLLSSILIYCGLAVGARIATRRVNGNAGWLAALLNVPLILTAYWLGAQIVNLDREQLPLEALIASVFLIMTVPALVRLPWASSAALSQAGWLLFADLLLLVFGGLGLGFLSALVFPALVPQPWIVALIYTSAGIAALVILLARSADAPQVLQNLTRCTYLLQLPIPLLFFSLLPRPTLYRHQRIPAPHSWLLTTVIAGLCLFAWIRLCRRYSRRPRLLFRLRDHIEPLCLAAITICFVYFVPYATILADDFHFGEQYLPWQQLVQLGRLPYIDIIPIHGSMAMLEGAIGSLFFHGTAADFDNSVSILEAIAAVLTFLCLYRAAGIAAALFFCLCLTHLNRLYFFGLVLIFLVERRSLRSVAAWLAVGAAVLFSITYNVPVGLALAIGILPMICHQGWLLWRSNRARFGRIAACFAGVFVLCAAVPVLRKMCLGLVGFTLETGGTNTVANAMEWTGFVAVRTPTEEAVISPALLEALKFGWIVIVLIAAARLVSDGLSGWRRLWLPRNYLLWAIAISSIAMTPWTEGRISEGLSRPGLFSAYCAAAFLPLLLFRGVPRHARWTPGAPQSLLLFAVAALLGMYAAETRALAGIRQASARLIPLAPVPDELALVTPASSGLPNLGTLYLPPARVLEISAFQRALSSLVGPSGSYFDLTNRQALYSYTRRPEPALYASAYIAASHQQQERILAQLEAHHENVAYVAPAMRFDGLPASLRTYLLYRYVMLNYQPCKMGENIFFIDATLNRARCENVPDGAVMDSSFARWELGSLPTAWGASWSSLQQLFRPLVTQLTPIPAEGVTWDGRRFILSEENAFDERGYLSRNPDVAAAVKSGALSGYQHYMLYGKREGRSGGTRASVQIDFKEGVNPREYDFLTFRFVVQPAALASMELRWSSALGQTSQPVLFESEGGRVLLPLGAYPQWLKAAAIRSIAVNLSNAKSGSSWELADVQLLHYLPDDAVPSRSPDARGNR